MAKHTKSDDEQFISSIKPLFRRRRIYLALCIVCLAVFPTGSIASLLAIPIGFFALVKYSRASSAIDSVALKQFVNNLEPLGKTRSNKKHFFIGVMGSLGDGRQLLEIAGGRINGYEVSLWTYVVNWKPHRNNSSYFKQYRVLELTANRHFHHVFVDSISNSRLIGPSSMYILSKSLRKNPTLSVEGDVHKYFRIYVPVGHEREGLTTLSPDKLLALRDYGLHFDIEFVENKIYIISRSRIQRPEDILIYTSSAINLISSIGQNISRERTIAEDKLHVDEPFIITY